MIWTKWWRSSAARATPNRTKSPRAAWQMARIMRWNGNNQFRIIIYIERAHLLVTYSSTSSHTHPPLLAAQNNNNKNTHNCITDFVIWTGEKGCKQWSWQSIIACIPVVCLDVLGIGASVASVFLDLVLACLWNDSKKVWNGLLQSSTARLLF